MKTHLQMKLILLFAYARAALAGGHSTDYTINPDFTNVLVGSWDGFGTSLAWWAALVGGSKLESTYADLFFTTNTTTITTSDGVQHTLPGLGLNIIRYNIGGTGVAGDVVGLQEEYVGGRTDPATAYPYMEIQGYWKNWTSQDTKSSSWDWTRDANQRSMMTAAASRGVNIVEFFCKAPMWWMTNEYTSMGGTLRPEEIPNFATYAASVVDHSIDNWNIIPHTIEIMNEPSAGWWNIGTGQEGLNVPDDNVKVQLLQDLRGALNSKGRSSIAMSGVDENGVDDAQKSLGSIIDYVDRVNVHGYQNYDRGRRAVKRKVGSKPLWMSEYCDNDDSGLQLAQAITLDINILRPSAWLYWQVIDPGWGMLKLPGGTYQDPKDPARGTVAQISTKFYVTAQFTRFILPGDQILSNDDYYNTVLAYTPSTSTYKFITVNWQNGQFITINLNGINKSLPPSVTFTYTHTDGSANFATFQNEVSNNGIKYWADANVVYSVSI